ncbi:Glycosyl transferase, family 2 [Methylophaga thiooxydans]|uniref:Glycosyl transferase, family 2 n=1 Tax=Methylophaga thiooxydans TaxID=392484 RepID=A0A0A0BCK6_9GAMM|nr:TIGR04283 family arsenosugar biosynthesis glycosyltransferase [Methylophaga thiooxydans]KGM06288.1 Glycosyl transferase, family 2 [Methylophaga thiooxydans]
MTPLLAIIVPVLNEAKNLPALLSHLLPFHGRGVEIILVDGGSTDESVSIIRGSPFKLVISERGRGKQMNAGARSSSAENLLFLHADTRLPDNADIRITSSLLTRHWGRFDVHIAGSHPLLKVIAFMMNWRSRLTGVSTGDQAIFMKRSAYDLVLGFPSQMLMEDIAISRELKQLSRPVCIDEKVSTSGRRWNEYGVWRTITLMWRLRFFYWLGTDPNILAERYK